jgi:acetylornithine/N-succinyldiaminopimelate aminotransferase
MIPPAPTPGGGMAATLARSARYVMPTYGRAPVAMCRGAGTRLWDEDGREYLDFCTGIAVCSLGHAHPALQQALVRQAAELWHCSNLYHIGRQAELAGFLVETVAALPGKVFFANSGAEANDGLIKAARRFGHARPDAAGSPRSLVLTFTNSFHGRTLGGIAATGQDKVKEGFAPLLPGFRHLPFNDLDAVAAAMAGGAVAAVLVEAIQGEGGVNVASKDFLLGLAELCRAHDALLFLDEVQCGIGRAGDWCGWRAVLGDSAGNIRPDGMSWAKGMGGGFPTGAFWLGDRLVRDDLPLHDLLGPGSHGSTYGGSPLAAAVALAVLREIHDHDLCARARAAGARLQAGVAALGSPLVRGTRGLGLLLGIELDVAAVAAARLPAAATPALQISNACLAAGLLTVAAGPGVLRLLPPLNVSDADCDAALAILARVLAPGGA